MEKQKISYRDAGVNIDAGNNLIDNIKPLAHSTNRPGAHTQLGGFGALFDLAQIKYKDPLLISSTDGVGTKLKLAQQINKHDTIGIDLVAMCVNDILAQGAEPLFFLDYFSTGKLEPEQATEVIRGIAQGCKQSNCALIGGETAEMPGMYQDGEYDLAGFAVGIVERHQVLPQKDNIRAGDVIIGLASSGLHSNGFSLVRHLINKHNININNPAPFDTNKPLYKMLLEPTRIYVSSLLPLIWQNKIKALAHITGGGLLENVPRILPKHVSAHIDMSSWQIPSIFRWLQQLGNVDTKEMIRTFNMGIGLIAIIEEKEINSFFDQFNNEQVYRIGSIEKRINTAIHIS